MKRISSQGFIVSLLLTVLISACTRNHAARNDARDEQRAPAEIITEQSVGSGFDLSSASLVGTGSFTEEIEAEAGNFSSHPCTENCSGHDAGYAWAERNGVADPNDCGGESDSFIEGCTAYAAAQRDDRDTQDE
jgi:hypothetical protein